MQISFSCFPSWPRKHSSQSDFPVKLNLSKKKKKRSCLISGQLVRLNNNRSKTRMFHAVMWDGTTAGTVVGITVPRCVASRASPREGRRPGQGREDRPGRGTPKMSSKKKRGQIKIILAEMRGWTREASRGGPSSFAIRVVSNRIIDRQEPEGVVFQYWKSNTCHF